MSKVVLNPEATMHHLAMHPDQTDAVPIKKRKEKKRLDCSSAVYLVIALMEEKKSPSTGNSDGLLKLDFLSSIFSFYQNP